MRELESRIARARAQHVDSSGHPDAAADVLRESGNNGFGTMLERPSHAHDASTANRLITRSPGEDGHQIGHKSSSGRRDDHEDDDDDKDEKKGKKKDSKGGGKGKKKGKGDDDDKPKKHPIQPPAPPSSPHPFPHPPPHLPPPHGPPPKSPHPHPPFHPTGGTHPKVALSSSADDDTLTTPVAKPTKSSSSTAEPSAPPENTPESAPPHESQTYTGGTFTQPVTATAPLSKQGSQPHVTISQLEPTASPATNAKKGFPLAAAGILGGVLSFLIVSGIVWGIWLWMRRRRRARAPPSQWDFPPSALRPQSDGITVSTRTISTTVPQFASAAEAGAPSRAAANANPFAHRDDGRERDPFASAPPTLRLGTIDAPLSRMFI